MSKLVDSKDHTTLQTGVILGLSFTLGLSFKKTYKLKVDAFLEEFSYHRLQIPLWKSQWKPSTSDEPNIFQTVIEELKLPLPSQLTKPLKKLKNITQADPYIFDQNKAIKKHLLKSLKKEVAKIRKTKSSHIKLVRIAASLKSEIYSKYQNPTLVYLLNKKTNLKPPHTRFYYVPNQKQLIDTWIDAQKALWGKSPPQQLELYQDEAWNGYVLQPDKFKSFLDRIQAQPNQNDLVRFHNWFTTYTILMLTWNLGHRAVTDPLCEQNLLNLESDLILINDKKKHGSNNFRILKLPRLLKSQYESYLSHLNSLAINIKNLGKESDLYNIGLYIQKIIAPTKREVKQRRLFFLIKDNGKSIRAIKPKYLQEVLRTNSLPVKSNFGRHHIATRLMYEYNFSYPQVQLFLGHSMKLKTGLTSELTILETIKKISVAINEIAINDGWLLLKGINHSKQSEPLILKSIKSPLESIYPKKEPGYILREQYQNEQKVKIKKLTKELKNYLNKIARDLESKTTTKNTEHVGDINRSEEIELQFREEIKGLDFPHHIQWRELLGYIRDEFDGKNPLPSVLKYNQLSTGISSLNKTTANKFETIDATCSQWPRWLNSEWHTWINSSVDSNIRFARLRATLIVNAALIGRATREEVILGLGFKRYSNIQYYYELYVTAGITHIEIYKKEKYEIDKETFWETSWCDRWLPDPFSKALLIGIHGSPTPKISDSQIEIELSNVKDLLNLPFSRSSTFKNIAKMYRHKSVLEFSGCHYAIQSGKFRRRPLSIESWTRSITQNQWLKEELSESLPEISINEKQQYIKSTESNNEHFDSKKFETYINKILENHINNASSRRSVQCSRIAASFEKISNKLTNAPLPILMFLSWTVIFCERGTKGYSKNGKIKLQDTTIKEYVIRLYKNLFLTETFPYFESMTGDEITEFYKSVIESYPSKTKKHNLKQLIYMFQIHAENMYQIEECDWEVLDGIPIRYIPSNRGSIVTSEEYQLLLITLVGELSSQDHAFVLSCLLTSIMIYRFGLRPSEVTRLKPADLIFDSDGSLHSVIVKGKTKSKSGVRQVFNTYLLLEIESFVIRNSFERSSAYSKINGDFTLSSRYIKGETSYTRSKWRAEYQQKISLILKSISGDSNLSTYSLRHSFVTNQIASLLKKQNLHSVENNLYSISNTDSLRESNRFHSPLKSLSVSMGHKSITTTLQVYTHCLEMMDSYDYDSLNTIKDRTYALALGKKKVAFQTQKSRLGSNVNVVDSYLFKLGAPSLESKTKKRKSYKTLDVKSIQLKKTSILQITDFLIIKSKSKNTSITSLYRQSAFTEVAKSIVKIQKNTNISSLVDLFRNTRLTHLELLVTWLQKNEASLEKLLRLKKNRTSIAKKLVLFCDSLEPLSGKWVVINENEVTSLASLLNILNIEFSISKRVSSRADVRQKKSVVIAENNHAANHLHKDIVRQKNGYELQMSFDNQIKNMRVLNLILIILNLYILNS